MKIVLLSINAKYVHSSLAVWYIAAGINKYSNKKHELEVVETTINQPICDITNAVIAEGPDMVGISTYIWNASILPDIIINLRRELPRVIIAAGGPEASNNPDFWLKNGFDYIIRGEGEESFPRLVDEISENIIPPKIINAAPMTDFIHPFSDDYFNRLNGRLAYIEASRGCPFSCAYCLSGDSSVRYFPLDTVFEKIKRLSESNAKTIKFVDRTFNCHPKRAYDILEFVIGLDTKCCFHFEIAADLLDKRTLDLLKASPPGRIQFEIGLQSFHLPTLNAVGRKSDLDLAEKYIRQIVAMQNIHVHIDLIAGLPLETLSLFKLSFNRAYAIGAHVLQLGFLKLLRGSRLHEQAAELSIIYDENPPYEIKSNPWLDSYELETIKQTENALQNTYNKGHFLSVLQYVFDTSNITPFDFFNRLGKTVHKHAMPLELYADKVYNFCASLPNIDPRELSNRMKCDLLCKTRGKSIPRRLKYQGNLRRQTAEAASAKLGRSIDCDEVEILSSGKGVYIDSADRDPVTGMYRLYSID